jgi:hypothetical protein
LSEAAVDYNLCFLCGDRFDYVPTGNSDQNGRFCSDECRSAYDHGTPGYHQDWLRKETGLSPGYVPKTFPKGREGFLIPCANCGEIFDSKGVRCCSSECERALRDGVKVERKRSVIKSFREPLIALASALDISVKTIKREGDQWLIRGRKGTILADLEYWYVQVPLTSDRQVSNLKRKLNFMDLVGSEFRRQRLPTPELAEIIRKVVGLRRKPIITEGRKKALQQQAAEMRGIAPLKSLVS